VKGKQLFISAFTIGVGYLIGGLIPLFPYLFIHNAKVALFWSCIVTGITLLLFGVVKTYFTGAKGGFGGYLESSSQLTTRHRPPCLLSINVW